MTSRAVGLFLVLMAALTVRDASTQQEHYDEPFRPQVHFSPQRNWMNDPNGLVYFHGEYHLFFQYNPFGDAWGHMSWGHAASRDLLHWRQLPLAIPEENGVMIFTGSVVIDPNDRSGLCEAAKECMVAIYSGDGDTPEGHRQTQNLAYSLDEGRTWTKYRKNPVLDLHRADFRDPSVSWDDARHRWIMAVSLPREHRVSFYYSGDLKQWVHASDFGPAGDTNGEWECPDLLRVPSQGNQKSLWALKVGLNPGAPQGGSGEQYFLGEFDGSTFHVSEQSGAHGWTNYGKDDYCAISFNGIPGGVRPVLLGWMNNWEYAQKLPTSPWRGQMSVARRLSFVRDGAGLALAQEPVIAPLRKTAVTIRRSTVEGEEQAMVILSPPYELDFDEPSRSAKNYGVRIYSDGLNWTEIGFDLVRNVFYVDRTKSGDTSIAGFGVRTDAFLTRGRANNAKMIVDRSSVEAYVQGGTIAMTDLIYPTGDKDRIVFFSSDPGDGKTHARLWKLSSIWRTSDTRRDATNQ